MCGVLEEGCFYSFVQAQNFGIEQTAGVQSPLGCYGLLLQVTIGHRSLAAVNVYLHGCPLTTPHRVLDMPTRVVEVLLLAHPSPAVHDFADACRVLVGHVVLAS